jgi:hypothetical protein
MERMIVGAALQLQRKTIRKRAQIQDEAYYQFFKARTIAAVRVRDTCAVANYVTISDMATRLRVGRVVTGDDDTLVSALRSHL